MATVRRTISRPRAAVFEALITPETYPHWLVGAKEIRSVDDGWPAPGSKFHHRVGLGGPLTVADNTKVLEIDEPSRLVLEVRARPLGRGKSTFVLTEKDDGGSTEVELDEVPIGLMAPTEPVAAPLIIHRNTVSLRKLAQYLGG